LGVPTILTEAFVANVGIVLLKFIFIIPLILDTKYVTQLTIWRGAQLKHRDNFTFNFYTVDKALLNTITIISNCNVGMTAN